MWIGHGLDNAMLRLNSVTNLGGEVSQMERPDIRRKDEPSNGLVDTRGVLRTFVERCEPSDLDNRDLAPPP